MKRLAISLMIILFVSGCASTPTKNIEAFGLATKNVTNKIDTLMSQYNSAEINDTITSVAQSKKSFKIYSFAPIEKVLARKANKKNYALYKANDALGKYAEALSGLAKAGDRGKTDLAATKLYASIYNFNKQYKILNETTTDLIPKEKIAIFGKIVAGVSGLYFEQKRGKAIRSCF